MMGRLERGEALFYEFRLEDRVPNDHPLRKIDRLLDLSELRAGLQDLYTHPGRPSVDPELMIRMLLFGYLYGIRSETRLCQEVHLNLAYRWFCKLGLDGRDRRRQGHDLKLRADIPERRLKRYQGNKKICGACPIKATCTDAPSRSLAVSTDETLREKVRAIAETEAYQSARRRRKKVEMLFAHLSEVPFWTKELFQGGVVSFDPIVKIFAVDMSDAIIRTDIEIHLFDDLSITLCFVRNDCHRLIASNCLTGLTHTLNPCFQRAVYIRLMESKTD